MSNEPQHNDPVLPAQTQRVYNAMKGGAWLTLPELHEITSDPIPSISAQIRFLKRPEYGSHKIKKQRRGESRRGLFEYRLIEPQGVEPK